MRLDGAPFLSFRCSLFFPSDARTLAFIHDNSMISLYTFLLVYRRCSRLCIIVILWASTSLDYSFCVSGLGGLGPDSADHAEMPRAREPGDP